MEIRSRLENDWLTVFYLKGEIDAATAPPLKEALELALAEGLRWFLIDLLGTEYLDSVALGILIGGAKQADQAGGMLAVVCNRPNLVKIFEVSGTKELLNVRESEAAVRSLLEAARQACPQPEDGGA